MSEEKAAETSASAAAEPSQAVSSAVTPHGTEPSTPTPNSSSTTKTPESSPLLEGLVLLPPRQQQQTSNASMTHAVVLPPLRAEEPVQSLRGALSEVIGYAHMTQFRLEVLRPQQTTDDSITKQSEPLPLISPYVGVHAVTVPSLTVLSPHEESTRSSTKEEEQDKTVEEDPLVLDEYGTLTQLLRTNENDDEKKEDVVYHTQIQMVLERYDAATSKDHVARLRQLCSGNAPSAVSLLEDDAESNSNPNNTDQEKSTPLPSFSLSPETLDDFFYHASGERRECYHPSTHHTNNTSANAPNGPKKANGKQVKQSAEQKLAASLRRWNELEEQTKVPLQINYSGYHPPPSTRKWMGDLAYLELSVTAQDKQPEQVLFITGTTTGFYVNNSTRTRFDPSPQDPPHYAHTLLDCALQASSRLQTTWKAALMASQERAALLKRLNQDPVLSFFRIATRPDFVSPNNHSSSILASTIALLDSSMGTPSWLLPTGNDSSAKNKHDWTGHSHHTYAPDRALDDLTQTHGLDVRNGGIRDWNEELQMAREMPSETLSERVERARLLHKVLTEFGEASWYSVQAIATGHLSPMNPNEPIRSQVFLHNNIFVSRAVDAGPETFKVATGDAAARKAANRDIQCISTFHRSFSEGETPVLYTLATVLIDYLGTRYICQSILPGILIGDKSHTLLYGAVETGAPLKWDNEFHRILTEHIGDAMMLATRPVYRMPITQERLAQVDEFKAKHISFFLDTKQGKATTETLTDPNETMSTCIPIEAKGILGSDKRQYLLDFGRLTPRDANWVPQEQGGTGKWETSQDHSGSLIPKSLIDDEWTMHVLRPELVTRFTQTRMGLYIQDKKKKAAQKEEVESTKEKETTGNESENRAIEDNAESETETKKVEENVAKKEDKIDLTKEDADDANEYLQRLKLNLNVFLPHMRAAEGELAETLKKDEALVREISVYLWDEVLPRLSRGIKDGSLQPVPMDGRTLTEFLHRQGVNCRYLGRVASLAREEEVRDEATNAQIKDGTSTLIERRTMPKCWLELLECEIVARAAKHVLDAYLTEKSCIAAAQPAQTIASFLSALVSEREETAGQTETRLEKRQGPDEDDFNALTFTGALDGDNTSGDIRSRGEVWKDIEAEVGRRFRYTLTLYNRGNKNGRALYIPLLRRLCQRSGIRLYAKSYDVGNRCLCVGGNNLTGKFVESYPITPLDVVDIVPLMKHTSSYSEGFSPCTTGNTVSLPPLQVSLRDARNALERAHIQTSARALGRGLELAQEAASLYQRVTDNAAHPGVIESIELMSNIFYEAGDAELATVNGAKTLALAIQSSGFDTPRVVSSHMSLFQMYYAAKNPAQAVKHLHAAIYILQIMAGPQHTEIFNAYHKLASVYSSEKSEGQNNDIALKFLQEAEQRDSCDRLMNGVAFKSHAKIHASLKEFKEAVEAEKKSLGVFTLFLGKEHQLTKESELDLKGYMTMAIEHTKGQAADEKIRLEEAKADAIAAALTAEEEKKEKKSVTKKKKGKK